MRYTRTPGRCPLLICPCQISLPPQPTWQPAPLRELASVQPFWPRPYCTCPYENTRPASVTAAATAILTVRLTRARASASSTAPGARALHQSTASRRLAPSGILTSSESLGIARPSCAAARQTHAFRTRRARPVSGRSESRPPRPAPIPPTLSPPSALSARPAPRPPRPLREPELLWTIVDIEIPPELPHCRGLLHCIDAAGRPRAHDETAVERVGHCDE
jgi:hypothetical protein